MLYICGAFPFPRSPSSEPADIKSAERGAVLAGTKTPDVNLILYRSLVASFSRVGAAPAWAFRPFTESRPSWPGES